MIIFFNRVKRFLKMRLIRYVFYVFCQSKTILFSLLVIYNYDELLNDKYAFSWLIFFSFIVILVRGLSVWVKLIDYIDNQTSDLFLNIIEVFNFHQVLSRTKYAYDDEFSTFLNYYYNGIHF